MNDPRNAAEPEDFGYFHDTIHGRFSLDDLPAEFHPALKVALASPALARLKRVSQLGHTSLSFLSATHTRFSHAVGTMIVMNRLFQHVDGRGGVSPDLYVEAAKYYESSVAHFPDLHSFVRCHLLLTALYQDAGELPFHRVIGSLFCPVEAEIEGIANDIRGVTPQRWKLKEQLTLLAFLADYRNQLAPELRIYNSEFICYLITGDGMPSGAQHLGALRQMTDGAIDADRLDYVFRDASVTIGGLGDPKCVIENVVAYRPDHVVVSDARPIADFLSTRMRLWTFVYMSPDVRFRRCLLHAVLEGRWDSPETVKAFESTEIKVALPFTSALSYAAFLQLDDDSLMSCVKQLDGTHLKAFRRVAKDLLLQDTLDYEFRVLKRSGSLSEDIPIDDLPRDLFFDLLRDADDVRLYRPLSVRVRQSVLSQISAEVPIEDCTGALAPLFTDQNGPALVRDSYYLFFPRNPVGERWSDIRAALQKGTIYRRLAYEYATRTLIHPSDTRHIFRGEFPEVGISYCSRDFETVVRIVRVLFAKRVPYRLLVRPLDGIGSTARDNSEELIRESKAVLVLVSSEYIKRAKDGSSYIAGEVREIHKRSGAIPVAVLGLDVRRQLQRAATEAQFSWDELGIGQREPIVLDSHALRDASEGTILRTVESVLRYMLNWTRSS